MVLMHFVPLMQTPSRRLPSSTIPLHYLPDVVVTGEPALSYLLVVKRRFYRIVMRGVKVL
jgi:hypothetical protein